MKNLVAILLLFGLLSQTFSKLSIFLGYELNRNYIALHLCENRNNPKIHCHGCCLLKKELKADENKDKQLPNSSREEALLLFHENQEDFHSAVYSIVIIQPAFYQGFIPSSQPASIFHPPRA